MVTATADTMIAGLRIAKIIKDVILPAYGTIGIFNHALQLPLVPLTLGIQSFVVNRQAVHWFDGVDQFGGIGPPTRRVAAPDEAGAFQKVQGSGHGHVIGGAGHVLGDIRDGFLDGTLGTQAEQGFARVGDDVTGRIGALDK